MLCKNCNYNNNISNKFCDNCGYLLNNPLYKNYENSINYKKLLLLTFIALLAFSVPQKTNMKIVKNKGLAPPKNNSNKNVDATKLDFDHIRKQLKEVYFGVGSEHFDSGEDYINLLEIINRTIIDSNTETLKLKIVLVYPEATVKCLVSCNLVYKYSWTVKNLKMIEIQEVTPKETADVALMNILKYGKIYATSTDVTYEFNHEYRDSIELRSIEYDESNRIYTCDMITPDTNFIVKFIFNKESLEWEIISLTFNSNYPS